MIETICISNEIVTLEFLDVKKRLDIIRGLKGPFILDRIVCDKCLTLVNLLDPKVMVNKRIINIGSVSNTALEPLCPRCGNFIPAEYFFHVLS